MLPNLRAILGKAQEGSGGVGRNSVISLLGEKNSLLSVKTFPAIGKNLPCYRQKSSLPVTHVLGQRVGFVS
jgi:hypothetical protein